MSTHKPTFLISESDVYTNGNKTSSLQKRGFHSRIQEAIKLCNLLVLEPKCGIANVRTSLDGHLVYISSKDGRSKELLAQDLEPEFANFIVLLMFSHTFASEPALQNIAKGNCLPSLQPSSQV